MALLPTVSTTLLLETWYVFLRIDLKLTFSNKKSQKVYINSRHVYNKERYSCQELALRRTLDVMRAL